MAEDKPVFIYIATYDTLADAQEDYEAVKVLHKDGVIGTYDASIISKDADGKVRVTKHEKPTQHGAWTGVAAGALFGIFFPPSILVSAGVGAGAGGLIGHFWKGLPRESMEEIGKMLDESDAALVVIGESKLQEYLEKALKKATKQYEKELMADTRAFNKDLDEAVDEMIKS